MANKKIKGITIELGADPTGLYDALDGVEKGTNAAKSNLRDVDRAIKAMPESVALWSQKQQILTTAIEESRKKLQLLEGAQAQVNQQFADGKISQDQFFAFERELEFARAEVGKFESQLSEVNDRFSRTADDAKEAAGAIEEMGEEAETAGEKAETSGDGYTVLKGAMADLAADGIRAAADALKELAVEGETALDSLQTKTGATADQMAEYEGIITDLYGKGMGEDKRDLSDSIAEVKQQLGDIDSGKLAEVSENALVLRDTFGFDIAENVRAASMLMQKFGITADEAYNLIAQGAQNGLNKNGDLMDVINEYGVHYSQLGYSAEEFFNSLYNGAATGVFSVDKLGDAMKEFGIRTKDTAESTNEGFALLGLNADEMRSKFAAGGESAKLATQETITALFAMSDKVKQNQAGVALFGTMWEDLGADAVKALTNVTGAADQTASTLEEIGEIKYDNLENNLERVTRKAKTDLLEPVVEDLLPLAEDGVDFLVENIPKVANTLEPITGLLKPILSVAGDIFSVGLDGLSMLADVTGGIIDVFTGEKIETAGETAKKGLEEYRDKCKETSNELITLQESACAAAETELIQQGRTKELWEELQTLADASGKVKTKDQERAEYIVGELQEATGIEIGYVDGQIQKYDELCQKIDDVIAKKRAQAYLDAYGGNYIEIKEKAIEAQSDYITKRNELEAMYDPQVRNQYFLENYGVEWEDANYAQRQEYDAAISAKQSEVRLAEESYSENTAALNRINEAEEAFASGKYEQVEGILNAEISANEEILRDTQRTTQERETAFKAMCDEMEYSMYLANAHNSADLQRTTAELMVKLVEDYEAGGLTSGVEFSAEFKTELQKAMDAGINFDSFILAAGNAGWDIGTLLGESAVQRYQEILAENLRIETQRKYANNNLIVKSIQSQSDYELYKQGKYLVDETPKFATGGFLHQGEAIVAEAGPELIRIMEGGVQVTPLTATARNHAVESSSGQRVFYNQITVNATVSNDMDVTKLGQKLAAQLQASERGAGR